MNNNFYNLVKTEIINSFQTIDIDESNGSFTSTIITSLGFVDVDLSKDQVKTFKLSLKFHDKELALSNGMLCDNGGTLKFVIFIEGSSIFDRSKNAFDIVSPTLNKIKI